MYYQQPNKRFYLSFIGHNRHLALASPWPLLVSILLFQFVGLMLMLFSSVCFGFGKLLLLIHFSFFVIYSWMYDIGIEATCIGMHTRVVTRGLRLGMFLFILSEAMLFLSFF